MSDSLSGQPVVKDNPNPASRLSDIRKEIDEVDRQLLELLNRRSALSREVGKLKADNDKSVFKSRREHELLENLANINPGTLPNEHMRAIWREILSSSRALQKPQKVAYLGPIGTFSYFAALEYLGHSAELLPCKDIEEIYEKVANKFCNLGVVPLENSLQGTVGISVDLFLRYNVVIVAELYSRISQSLLSRMDALSEVKKVYSHPQPLAQCGKWLRSHLPNANFIPVESTAAAAKMAASEPDTAAIGNVRLASMYDLKILATHIEDNKNNWTRFVVIERPEDKQTSIKNPAVENKSSLIFIIPDKPGTLARVLDLLGKNGLNMRKLESRPMSGQPWKYVFFADIENNLHHPDYKAVLTELGEACIEYRILGSYPFGPQLDHFSEETEESTSQWK